MVQDQQDMNVLFWDLTVTKNAFCVNMNAGTACLKKTLCDVYMIQTKWRKLDDRFK